MRVIGVTLRTLLAAFLVVAAISKVMDYPAFADTIRLSGLFPPFLQVVVAPGIIALEFVLAAWLLISWKAVKPAYATCVLGGLFLGYAVWRYKMGIPSPCHCLGKLADLGPVQSIELASLFWLLSAATLLLSPRPTLKLQGA